MQYSITDLMYVWGAVWQGFLSCGIGNSIIKSTAIFYLFFNFMKNCVCVCVGGGPFTLAMCWIVCHSSYLCTSKRREKINVYVYNSRFSINIKFDSRTISKKEQIWKTYLFIHLICKFKRKVFVYAFHVGDRKIGISRELVGYD